MDNYYKVLGISQQAGSAEIKKAFRSLAKRYHPDLNPDPEAAAKFIAVEVAYTCLSKSDSRRAHDLLLKYSRQSFAKPTVKKKYQNDVKRRKRHGKHNAKRHVQMSYKQFKRDELLRNTFYAQLINTAFSIIVAIAVGASFYQLAIFLYGENTNEWGQNGTVYVLAASYILILIGISYLYEPLVKLLIIGKPKRSKTRK